MPKAQASRQLSDRTIYRYLLAAVIGIVAIGTIFYHLVEHFSWLNAYYFSVVTLSTVGYGDLTPHTAAGKLFTTLYIFTGVGILATFLNFKLRRRANKRFGGRISRDSDEEA